MSDLFIVNRRLRRVPLDFSWPVGRVWDGFQRQGDLEFPPCWVCGPASGGRYGRNRHGDLGDGYSPGARAINRTFYCIDVADPWLREQMSWRDKLGLTEVARLVERGLLPQGVTAAEVNAANGPGRPSWDHRDLRLAGNAAHELLLLRCELLGIEHTCAACGGQGDEATDELRAQADAWEPTEPPVGAGYQMWESTSEGSPISPVFASEDTLAGWLAEHMTGVGYSGWLTKEEWLEVMGANGGAAVDVATGGLVTPRAGGSQGV